MLRACRLPDEEIRALARHYRKTGDPAALATLCASQEARIVKIAYQHVGQGHSAEDLQAEGRVGLVIAAQKYDPGRRATFGTYATFWIRAYILRHIMVFHGPVVAFKSVAMRRIYYKVLAAQRKHDGNATAETLAHELGEPMHQVERVLSRLTRCDPSIDDPNTPEITRGAGDAGNPEAAFLQDEAVHRSAQRVATVLGALTPRERIVVERHLDAGGKRTLQDIGAGFGVSRERTRQIEAKAFAKLRPLLQNAA